MHSSGIKYASSCQQQGWNVIWTIIHKHLLNKLEIFIADNWYSVVLITNLGLIIIDVFCYPPDQRFKVGEADLFAGLQSKLFYT